MRLLAALVEGRAARLSLLVAADLCGGINHGARGVRRQYAAGARSVTTARYQRYQQDGVHGAAAAAAGAGAAAAGACDFTGAALATRSYSALAGGRDAANRWESRAAGMGCSTSKVSTSSPQKSAGSARDDDYIEGVVCKAADIGENEMKAFQMGEAGKVLVVRQNGVLSALGSKCTHYGAPLETGALGDGRVRCPWHGACFNLKTGDIEDFPGLDSLPCFKVQVTADNNVVVRAKRSELKSSKRVRKMVGPDEAERAHVVIIGGGPSGNSCAETLRQNNFTGKITMLCREKYLPYDRVKISKILDAPLDTIQMRSDDFYKQHGIELCRSNPATSLDAANKKVILQDGSCVPFTKLYIATGSTALRPRIPGVDLRNVFTLRDYEDAQRVHPLLDADKHVVVLGASFIAMEAAAYCQGKVKSVTVVGRDEFPFQKLLGAEIGAAVRALFEAKGVKFVMNSGIAEFQGADAVQRAKLTTGETINADVVVLGTGSTLNTEFLRDSGVALNSHGAVEVDEFLQTNIPNVYAGGDIANAPVYSWDNRKSAIGHFGLAQYHGRIAGLNLAGKQTCQQTVPFFWTMLFGNGIRYCGHGSFDEILYTGDVPGLKYAAYFIKDGVVTAVSTCILPGAAEYANRVASGRKLYRQDLGANYSAWMAKDNEKTSL